jgi:heme oxygenase
MDAGRVVSSMIYYNPEKEKQMKLSEQLKERSKKEHQEVESTPFMAKLARGELLDKEYVGYLIALKGIYSQLEKELAANNQMKALENFVTDEFKVLYRTTAIEKDLEAFGVKDEAPVAGVQEYVDHLKEISHAKPHLLIAHVYIRYLGDLFGGQMIKKKLEPLWPDKVAFYHYPAPLDKRPMMFVKEFKEMLDGALESEREMEEVVGEALWAYKQHTAIFSNLHK